MTDLVRAATPAHETAERIARATGGAVTPTVSVPLPPSCTPAPAYVAVIVCVEAPPLGV